jgi:adenine-specific DNA glycosylase
MELGATVCLPKRPDCARCPIARHCEARSQGTESQLPVKLRRSKVERIEKTVLVCRRGGKLLLRQRPTSPMEGFWELPEADELPGASIERPAGTFRHGIMNRDYAITVCPATVRRAPPCYHWISREKLEALPRTTVTRKALALLEGMEPCPD